MTPCRGLFHEYIKLDRPEPVTLGDGKSVEAIGIGRVKARVRLNQKPSHVVCMHGVLHVLDLAANLFSVPPAAKKGTIVQSGHTRCWLKDSDRSNGHSREDSVLSRL